MEQQHKKFILSNIRTLCEFNLSSIKHLGECAHEDGSEELNSHYKSLYLLFFTARAEIDELLKGNKV